MFEQPHIFLSHSQRDQTLRDRFLANCGLAGMQGIAFEFDIQSGRVPLDRAAAEVIKVAIQSARALFVIVGRNVIASSYTSNWVAFEIGVAYASNPPVPLWVFEEVQQSVDFPVPTTDHHALFDPTNEQHWDWIRSIMESYANFNRRDPLSASATVCSYPNCKAVYQSHYPENITSWKCPSCRQELHRIEPYETGYHWTGPT